MSYTVLARRYRPETFDDVIAQEAVAKTLKNAIAADRVAHAYLFSGTRGVGKTTMARVLAKALNCLQSDAPTITPCCQCDSCIAISEGNDMDVIEIDGASNTGVEHIRELRQNAIYRPARARFKVYIIDEVHMLSTSAFNALLKTLEEPPEHVKFILATTEPNRVLPTILSRCQRFDFRNIQPEDVAGQLKRILKEEGVSADDALVRRVARLANGSMRDGLSLLDQLLSMSSGTLQLDLLDTLLGTPRSERIIALVSAIGNGDLADALTQLDTALAEGLALEQIITALQQHFRDLLILRNCGPDTELVDIPDAQTRETIVQQSQNFDDSALVYYITVTEELRRAVKATGTGRALVEAALVRLTTVDRFSDTKTLIQQLQGLKTSSNSSTPAPRSSAVAPRTTAAPAVPAADNTTTTSADQQFNPPAQITFEYLKENWPNIVAYIGRSGKRHLEAALRAGTVAQFQNGTIELEFGPTAGALKMLAARAEAVKEAQIVISQTLKQEIQLKLTPTDNPTTPVNNAAGAKPSQKEINAAINDPQVRQVQDLFGGTVKNVTRKK
ncbi:MAG: DNA polymerase III subunit gamma/tau [Sedimentisphaerales bacterium]|nr:DNA polymerase III subunit gamma/tau [Sedimentisphaerales bacterium]